MDHAHHGVSVSVPRSGQDKNIFVKKKIFQANK